MKIFEKLGGATKILRNFGGALKIFEILGGAPKNLGILKNSIQPPPPGIKKDQPLSELGLRPSPNPEPNENIYVPMQKKFAPFLGLKTV